MTLSTKAIEQGSTEEVSWEEGSELPVGKKNMEISIHCSAPPPLNNEHMSPESLALGSYTEVLEPTHGKLGVFFS